MLGARDRDARRTDRYLDGLMAAEERGASDAPMDLDVDPAILFAARRLRAELIRPHPSFRFEEGLANRLGLAAGRTRAFADASSVAPFRASGVSVWPAAATLADESPVPAPSRLPALTSRSARPLIVGGVASAAISIGAVYVAWRWSRGSRASHTPMERAVRAARSGRGRASGRSRRAGVLHGILGAMS